MRLNWTTADRANVRVTVVWHGAMTAESRLPFQYLHETGWDVTLIAPASWKLYVSQPQQYNPEPYETFRAIPLKVTADWHAVTFGYKGIKRVLDDSRPDLLFVYEEPYSRIAYGLMCWSVTRGVPLVVQTCQDLFKRYPPPFGWMERAVLKQCAVGLGLNQTCLNVLERKGFTGPSFVIPSGVALARYQDSSLEPMVKKAPGQPVFYMGYVGRLSPEKGVDLVLEALRELPDYVQLVVVGDGPERSRLRQMADRLGISRRIFWLGALEHAQLPSVYASLDVLVLASRTRPNWQEQFGRVSIEAMAAGVPVVGTRCGAIPEVLGDVGFLVEEDSPREIAAVVDRLAVNDELCRSQAVRGRERVTRYFTYQCVAEAYRRAFDTARQGRPSDEVKG